MSAPTCECVGYYDTITDEPQAMALRARLENLMEWMRLELVKKCIDAEATYEHASKLLEVVAAMRFMDPSALAMPQKTDSKGDIQ